MVIAFMKGKSAYYFIILFTAFSLRCFSQASISYQQMVRRDDVNLVLALKGTKGMLRLDSDSISFITDKAASRKASFAGSYTDVVKIKRYTSILIPNRIGIRSADGEIYRIFTYRRKKIIGIIESRMSRREK